MTLLVRVFVNGERVDVRAGATVLDAIRAWRASEADEVSRGARIVTDSRGLPAAHETAVAAGFILRVVPARKRSGTPEHAP